MKYWVNVIVVERICLLKVGYSVFGWDLKIDVEINKWYVII